MAKDGKCENLNAPGESTIVPPPPPTRTNGRAQPASRSTEGANGTTGVSGPAAGTERSKRTRSASCSPESEKSKKKKKKKKRGRKYTFRRTLLSAVHIANNQRETGERTATGGKGGWHLRRVAYPCLKARCLRNTEIHAMQRKGES